jgi:predicted nucleic acid-binding protein
VAGAVRSLERQALRHDAIVLDAHPVTAWINAELGAELIERLLDHATGGRPRLLMTVVNAAEVMIVQERRGGAAASHRTLDLLQDLPLELVPVDLELAARAAYFKVRGGISLANCFTAALAHREGIPLITGDPEFARVANSVEVLWFH